MTLPVTQVLNNHPHFYETIPDGLPEMGRGKVVGLGWWLRWDIDNLGTGGVFRAVF